MVLALAPMLIFHCISRGTPSSSLVSAHALQARGGAGGGGDDVLIDGACGMVLAPMVIVNGQQLLLPLLLLSGDLSSSAFSSLSDRLLLTLL